MISHQPRAFYLLSFFSQKRDQSCSPVVSPVTSPDLGSPPQRSLDIFVLLAGSNCCGHLLLARIPAQRLVSRGHKRAKSVFQSICYNLHIAFLRFQPSAMPRRIPSKVATLSAVAATALFLDPTSSCAYAFTPTPGTASSLRTPGPLHLSNKHEADSLVPRNSLHSLDGRTMASSSMRIPPTSTSSNLASRRDRMMVLHAAKNERGDIDYASMKPQVYPQRWVQLAYLSLLALLVSFVPAKSTQDVLEIF